jgi:uncharacterized membrane protein YhaH (DUF805 family)
MSDAILENDRPGVGRLYYFLARVVIITAMFFVIIYFGPASVAFKLLSFGTMTAGVVLDVMRLRNIGASQWLVFLRFVPYLGLVLSIALQSAQSGWNETKRLDRAGWAIFGTHVALIALVIFLIYRTQGSITIPHFAI